jgi:hypothetical protein
MTKMEGVMKFAVQVRTSGQLYPKVFIEEWFNGFTSLFRVTAVETNRFYAVRVEENPGEICLEKEFRFSDYGIDGEETPIRLYRQG